MSPDKPISSSSSFVLKVSACIQWMTAMMYMGWAGRGLPYMGVGRNMACKKSVYLEAYAEMKKKNIPFGDDDLLIQSISKKYRHALMLHPDSVMYTNPPSRFQEFISSKTRHLKAGTQYPLAVILRLAIYPASIIVHILTMITLS